ncbi:MAG: hypothetical protein H7126_15570 [Candidatus Parcubacteria bacterium]|nr:hypothetical protein [Leptolyngbyaceae cyanobacterium LF-bin-113]
MSAFFCTANPGSLLENAFVLEKVEALTMTHVAVHAEGNQTAPLPNLLYGLKAFLPLIHTILESGIATGSIGY